MPVRLSTLLNNIERDVHNLTNVSIIKEFYQYMKDNDTSESYQKNNLKAIFDFAKFIGANATFYTTNDKEQILSYLNSKIKSVENDPDRKWITTWNDYLARIKFFFRWLYNQREQQKRGEEPFPISDWQTPPFVQIKKKKTKRLSPYLATEIWERDEIFSIIKYEPYKRNKAALALLWDLDARNHEIILLKIKHIRLKKQYGEGEIPVEAKTGSGPILLTFSFPYVRDWLNEHPFRNESNARLICNLHTGAPITADALWTVMKQLHRRIIRLLETRSITDKNESERLAYLLKTKKWNPYCIRHSAITYDSDYLPEYAVKKKARWSMNSRQGARYIKKRMGNDLKRTILAQNGIFVENDEQGLKLKPAVINCPRCNLVNAVENKYCSECSYPLIPSAFEEIKAAEDMKINAIQEKHERDMKSLKEEMNHQFSQIMSMIQQNPKLAQVKPEILTKKKVENMD
jgi:hypothetical protein